MKDDEDFNEFDEDEYRSYKMVKILKKVEENINLHEGMMRLADMLIEDEARAEKEYEEAIKNGTYRVIGLHEQVTGQKYSDYLKERCNHEFIIYTGLNESFNHCKHCGKKE